MQSSKVPKQWETNFNQNFGITHVYLKLNGHFKPILTLKIPLKNLIEPLNFVNKPQSPMQTYFIMLIQVLNNDNPILTSIVALN